ncbi:MAG TPA: hypothetical protein VN861_20010 [Candidatus Acidoferrales bacterium]|nr:hypothetical protein [Candidatus Acidoferrales bacterium]
MHKLRPSFAVFYVFVLLLLSATVLRAAPQDASFVGSWTMTVTGGEDGGQGGGGGNRGGGNRGAGGAQSLTITQDGDKFKVSHKTRRGENAYDATVAGNTISWTEERTGPNGNSRKIQYKATLSGDTLKGTMAGGQFNREFSATRSAPAN